MNAPLTVRDSARSGIAGGPTVGIALRIVLGLLLLNVMVELAMRSSGSIMSTNTVVPLGDAFADFFRFVTSYPGGERIESGVPWLAERLAEYRETRELGGIAGLRVGALTHFNAPPLTTVMGLVSVRAMRWAEPLALYAVLCLSLSGYWYALVRRFTARPDERLAWMLLALLSYPVAMAVVRGNIYAGLTGLLIVQAVLLARGARSPRLSAVLLAVAVGMRPNAIAFAAPLLLLHAERGVVARYLAVAVPAISAAAMVVAHGLYPAYGPQTFLQGLPTYYDNYVVHRWGIPFGSSLFGALSIVLGPHAGLERAAVIVAGAIGLTGIVLHRSGRVGVAPLLFLVCAAYCLGSTVIADYHLFVFVLPVVAAAQTDRSEWRDGVAFVASCLMLSPKNYLFHGDVSIQPVLNPAILLVASALILAAAMRANAPRSAVPAPA